MQEPNDSVSLPLAYESRTRPARPAKAALLSAVGKGMAVGAIALVGGFVLLAMEEQPCRGATRSYKLKWEQRQAEIGETIAEQAPNDPALGA
jgi:hypothetical protein